MSDHLHSDAVAKDLVAELRKFGTFEYWRAVTRRAGVPDGAFGAFGIMLAVEFKSGKGKLNDAQAAWHAKWQGNPVAVLRSIGDVHRLVDSMRLFAKAYSEAVNAMAMIR